MNVSKVIGTGMALVAIAVFGLVLADDSLGLERAEAVPHSAYFVHKPSTVGAFTNSTSGQSGDQETAQRVSDSLVERQRLSFSAAEIADGTSMNDDGSIPVPEDGLPAGASYYALWTSSPLDDLRHHSGTVIGANSSVSGYFRLAAAARTINDVDGWLYIMGWTIDTTPYKNSCSVGEHTDQTACEAASGTWAVGDPDDYNGACSEGTHTSRSACEAAGGTYTPPDLPPSFSVNGEGGRRLVPIPLAGASVAENFAPSLLAVYPPGAVSTVKRAYPVPGMATVLRFAPLFLALGVIATLFGVSRRR